MQNDTVVAKIVRGGVKTVFVGCYIAFMWASIHHVAVFFNGFEDNSGNMWGSYMLAGAFDITALVTTMGVMFFRKSMPAWVFWIVWTFIIGIAAYSFFINWEYANHFQNMALITEPTGETTAVYDNQGILHYVPVMRVNTGLLWINPILASGFTIFSLIYSVIAEFFGTKAPTLAELQAKQTYLQETASVLDSIAQLEGKRKGKGLIASMKEKVIEGKEAWKEITKKEETTEESGQQDEGIVDQPDEETGQESGQESDRHFGESPEESKQKQTRTTNGNEEESTLVFALENLPSWLSSGGSTIPLQTVVRETKLSMKRLRNRVESHEIRATKNKDIVYKASLIRWMKTQGIIQESHQNAHTNKQGNVEETSSNEQDNAEEMTLNHERQARKPETEKLEATNGNGHRITTREDVITRDAFPDILE